MFRLFLLFAFIPALTPAKQPRINITAQEYWHPESESFIELHYRIDGLSLVLKESDKGYKGSLNITAMVLDGDSVLAFDKLRIHSPDIRDTMIPATLFELSRLAVPYGRWLLMIQISDPNGQDTVYTLQDSLTVSRPSGLSLSPLILTIRNPPSESWFHYGVSAMPRPSSGRDYFRERDSVLSFYTEVYQPDSAQRMVARYMIRDGHYKTPISRFAGIRRINGDAFQPISGAFDLRSLGTGTYEFYLELLDSTGMIVFRDSILFGRLNPGAESEDYNLSAIDHEDAIIGETDLKLLKFYVDCLFPISMPGERRQALVLVEDGDPHKLNLYLTAFWRKRNPGDPGTAWKEYLNQVEEVNRKYGAGPIPGYRSDRGRVLLQYGEPTLKEQRLFESDAYPYELWQYNQLNAPNSSPQSNKVFIFVNTQIASRNFQLIHSDAIGEPFDPQWKFRIMRQGTSSNPDNRSGEYNRDPFGSRLNNNTIINSGSSNRIDRR